MCEALHGTGWARRLHREPIGGVDGARIKANTAYRKSFDKAVEWSQDEHPCWKKYGTTENSATPNMLRYGNPQISEFLQ